MATDYSKKTVADLQEILKSRLLPHTGKKADLIARLTENDASQAESTPTPVAAPTEDVIDWDDDTAAAGAAAASTSNTESAAPAPKTEPAAAAEATTAQPEPERPSAATESKPAPVDFSARLASTDLGSELEKRKQRAARFGVADSPADTAKTEAEKALERAKRFGGDTGVVKGLDSALPDERTLREAHRGGRGGKFRGRGGRDGSRGPRRDVGKRESPRPVLANDSDRLAAEKRKQRFATERTAT